MAIVHENTTTWTNAASTSFSKTKPAAATTGRLIVLVVEQFTAGATFGASGFSSFAALSSGSCTVQVFYKIAVAGDAGGSQTITSSTAATALCGQFTVYSGVDTTTPVVATQSTNSGTMSTTSLVIAAVTMTNANSVLFGFYTDGSSTGYTPAGTMTERSDFNGGSRQAGSADEQIAATGSTGTRTITANLTTTSWSAIGIGINEAAAAASSFIWPTETPYRILSRR